MSDPRISFLGSISNEDTAELECVLTSTEIRISATRDTLATPTGQIVAYQLATLTARLFDCVTLDGDEAVLAHESLPMLKGRPFLSAVRQICSGPRQFPRGPQPTRTIQAWIGDGGGPTVDLYVGASAWSAFISPTSARSVIPSSCPVGALAAGTLAAAEVFKRAFEGKLNGAVSGRGYSLSLLSYEPHTDGEPLPADRLPIDLVLFGAGSIGTGFGHALSLAPQFAGKITVVDNGKFEDRNVYKYSLLDWKAAIANKKKSEWLARRLSALSRGRLNAVPRDCTAQEYVAKLDVGCKIPLAIAAVDTWEARMDIQDTLPRRIINAGISGTEVEVSVHGFGDGPCLACLAMRNYLESWNADAIAKGVGLEISRVYELIRRNLPMEAKDLETMRRSTVLPAEVLSTLSCFHGQPLLSLWNRAAYGDAVVTTGGNHEQVFVSTAFVSAFAGVLLLSELYKEVDPALTSYRLDNSYRQQMLGIPVYGGFHHDRDSKGLCLCHSSFRLHVYREKYGSLGAVL